MYCFIYISIVIVVNVALEYIKEFAEYMEQKHFTFHSF